MIPRRFLRKKEHIKSKGWNSFSGVEKWTICLSIIALFASAISIYFQFFYRSNILRISVTDCYSKNDSTITTDIVFQNMGNQYETVTTVNLRYKKLNVDTISFYTSDTLNGGPPIVLQPGQHSYRSLTVPVSFERKYFRRNDTVKVYVNCSYLNSEGEIADDDLLIGLFVLDSLNKIDHSDVYFSSRVLKGGNMGGKFGFKPFSKYRIVDTLNESNSK